MSTGICRRAVTAVLALVSLLAGQRRAWAEVQAMPLSEAVLLADAIVVAGIIETRTVTLEPLGGRATDPAATILARARVDEWMGGSPRRDEVWLIARSGWACDVSDARPAARFVLFLRRIQASARLVDASDSGLGASFDNLPLYESMHGGRGQIRIHERDGHAYGEVHASELLLPRMIEVLPGTEPRLLAIARGWVRLPELLGYLRFLLGSAPALASDLKRLDADLVAAVRARWLGDGSFSVPADAGRAACRAREAWALALDARQPRREVALWAWAAALGADPAAALLDRLGSQGVRGRRAAARALDLGQRTRRISLDGAHATRLAAHLSQAEHEEVLCDLVHAWAQAIDGDVSERMAWLRMVVDDPRAPVRWHAMEALSEAWFVNPYGDLDPDRARLPEWLEARVIRVAEGAHGREQRAAWRLLVDRCSSAAWPAARRATASDDPFVVVLSVMAVASMDHPKARALTERLRHAESPVVRAAATRNPPR